MGHGPTKAAFLPRPLLRYFETPGTYVSMREHVRNIYQYPPKRSLVDGCWALTGLNLVLGSRNSERGFCFLYVLISCFFLTFWRSIANHAPDVNMVEAWWV